VNRYLGICELIIMINDIHGVHLLLWSTDCFTKVLTTLYIICVHFMAKEFIMTKDIKEVIMIVSFICILYVMQFGLMCWICTLACEEFQRTGTCLYAFLLKFKNLKENCVKDEINDFSIQLQHHRIEFSACNFFEINNGLFSRVSTYFIYFIRI
jgi:hypothetical protein